MDEIINNEGMDNVVNNIAADVPDNGNVVGVLVGIGLTLAVAGAVKLGQMAYNAYQDHKKMHKAEKEIEVTPEDVEKIVK